MRVARRRTCNLPGPQSNRFSSRKQTPNLPIFLYQSDLVIASYSAASAPASNEKRMRGFSVLSSATAPRFPVLLFLGICKAGERLARPRAPGPCWVSSPVTGVMRPGVSSCLEHPRGTTIACGCASRRCKSGSHSRHLTHHGRGSRHISRA